MQMVDMDGPGAYALITRKIEVAVEPVYMESESVPQAGRHVWAYTIRLTNFGDETVRLISRRWRITDATGHVQDVRGEGVVGEQPVLRPGDEFEYTSGVPLSTPSGFMAGSYRMEPEHGQPFDIEIPAFSLDSPHANVQIH
jgi:ApaG protein